ncbi:MAG: GSCFA domain-containing protein [Saprospiraceae bacterium]|nr:GSCFA domain-containing protein [Saprospiraceae bacterium]
MQDFKTTLIPGKSSHEISHSDSILIMGSCFAQEIGKKLIENKFLLHESPFGIVYNPMSIWQQLNRIIDCDFYSEANPVFANDLYHSLDHHGDYSNPSKEELIVTINDGLRITHNVLKKLDYLIISFGSSYYYKYIESNQIVSNCHKIPSSQFSKVLPDLETISQNANQVIKRILQFNPSLKIILTISPVRYLRDGFVGNNRSKAKLISLVEHLEARFESIEYFPSYELLIDDLRDYRYYKDDMLHPSSIAIEYIWQAFSDSYFSDTTKEIIGEMNLINKFMNHRNTSILEKHVEGRNEKIKILIKNILEKYPILSNRF